MEKEFLHKKTRYRQVNLGIKGLSWLFRYCINCSRVIPYDTDSLIVKLFIRG